MDLTYGLNAENRIVATSETWDSYALSNGGSECISRLVLYRPIWDFVAGDELREFLGSVFEECRSAGREFSTLSRASDQTERKLVQMTVTPGQLGTIYVRHELIATSQKPVQQTVNLAGRRALQQCSICMQIRIGDSWRALRATPNARLFPRSHTICPSCRAKFGPGDPTTAQPVGSPDGKVNQRDGAVVRFPGPKPRKPGA